MLVRFIIVVVAIVALLNFCFHYIISDKFQNYGDRRKAQWTCLVNMKLGNFYLTLSKYKKGRTYFERLMKRCPEGKLAEEASYQIAYTYEMDNKPRMATKLYLEFLEKF